jgi:heterodisulfide reductase subunit A
VAVIGGGIAGIQAALDLAGASAHVYLIEKSPSLGGRMAQLDKTFPTNDCSICILSPKLVEAERHPEIEILVNSEVVECKGKPGNFKLKVLKRARYIHEEKCTGCGSCVEKCPKKIPNEFDMGMKNRKAIYVPFPQSVPLIYTIDKEHCIYFEKGKCRLCEKSCKSGAVDFEQEDEERILSVGSIIVATGYDQFDPTQIGEYGYAQNKNVITALEFERMLSASGPTEGRIFRPSDEKVPKSLTFIQCAGSRDENYKPYCSRVCCMYALKEAMLAREHESSIKEVNILYMDIRAFGKGFEEYYTRCRDEADVNFIRGRVSEILEMNEDGDLTLRYEDTEKGELDEIKTDLVVLSAALTPRASNAELAGALGIPLDDNGFFKERQINSAPTATEKEGVFICGCAQGPKDIPDSISQASCASAEALSYVDKRILKKVSKPEEEIVDETEAQKEPRIGVFVCNCGINIGGVIDVESVAKFAKKLPGVVEAQHNLFTCSESTQTKMAEAIKKHDLNRIIVAACTPRTHEPLFRDTCSKAGLNQYLFEMANVREHCSWVHSHDKKKATEKAKELVEMAVARAKLLRPLSSKTVDIEQRALVIGGGIAGIQAAVDLSNQNIKTYLVEKTSKLGGRLNELGKLSPSNIKSSDLLKEKLAILKSSDVQVFTDTEISNIDGFVGNFDVKLHEKAKKGKEKEHEIKVGAIIIAIGSEIYEPKGMFHFGKYKNVITNQELEKRIVKGEFKGKKNKTFTFILCVGAREVEGNTSCSRYCCQVGIKQAIELMETRIL